MRIRLLVGCVLAASLTLATWFVLQATTNTQLDEAKADYQTQQILLHRKIAKHNALKKKTHALRNAQHRYTTTIEHMSAQPDFSAVSNALNRLSKRYGLRLTHLLPTGTSVEDFYRFFDVQLQLQGTYQNLAKFVRAVGELEHSFAITEAILHNRENLHNVATQQSQGDRTPSSLGIQLRMRGYCCPTQHGQTADTTSPHSSTYPSELIEPKASIVDKPVIDPFSAQTKSIADTPPVPPTTPTPRTANTTPGATIPVFLRPTTAPTITIAPVRYTQAQRVASLLRTLLGEDAKNIAIDQRTNALILHSQGDLLQRTQDAILALDVPIRQVLIEAVIVIARHDFVKRLGVNLNFTAGSASNPPQNSAAFNLSGGLSANVQFSFLNNRRQLQLALDAMENSGEGEIISRPRLITGNLQTAYIKAGTQIPFQESAPNGRTTIQFIDAVLRLDVTPIIMPDDRIRLDLTINQDAPGAAINTGNGQIPSIDTTELRTQIVLKPNETAALGGVFRFDALRSRSKTPVLGDLPILGHLFRHTNKSIIKSETMFFITPNILDHE